MGVPWEDASVVVLVEVFMAETDYRREEREVEEGLLPPEELGVEPEDLQAVYQEALEMLYNGPHNNGSLTTALHTALQNAMGISFNASAFKLSEMREISANRPPSAPPPSLPPSIPPSPPPRLPPPSSPPPLPPPPPSPPPDMTQQ